MNSLEILLSVFQDGEYISKNVIASRIRDSPYPLRSIDLVSYLSCLLSTNPKCFNRRQGACRASIYSRTPVGDSILTEKVLDEIILAHLPLNKYVGFRGVMSRTRISKEKLKSRLLSLVQEGRLVKRANYEKEREPHYLKLENPPVEVVSATTLPVEPVPTTAEPLPIVPVTPLPAKRVVPERKARVPKVLENPPEKMVFNIRRRKKCPG